MAFAQLTHRRSLRDIEACLRSLQSKLYHLGIRGRVSRSTLAEANERRDWRIYRDFALHIIEIAKDLYANEDLGIDLDDTVYAFDSTFRGADAALRAWGLAETGTDSLSLGEAISALGERGLSTLALAGADIEDLRRLNLPALVRLRNARGQLGSVYLRRLSGDHAWLEGLLAGRTVRVTLGELEARWTGEAYAFWRDFEALPPVLRAGDAGSVIAWLQRALTRLGYYAQRTTGEFDSATRNAVSAFQAAQGLEPDGAVGPRTKIRLYEALDSYRVPALVRGEVGLARTP